MILLTTSRRPARRIRTLCRDLNRSILGTIRLNRGKMSLHGVGEKSAELGAERTVIIDRWRSGFDGFKVNGGITQVSPYMYILSVKLQREFSVPRKPGRLLVFDGTCMGNP